MKPEILILVLSVSANLLLLVLLLRMRQSAKPPDTSGMEAQLSRLRSEQSEQERAARKELSETISHSVHALGDGVATQLRQMEQRLKTFELANEQKMDAMRDTMTHRLRDMQTDNNEKLDTIRATVDEKLQKTLDEKMTQSFQLVSQRLEQVYKGLGEMQSLAVGVGDLKKVLSNVKTRGILGELQLGAILSELLAPEQYETNVATIPGSANRVEFAIKLPGEDEGHVYLPIDSKFPGDAYAALQSAYESGDPEAVKSAFATLSSRIRQSAKDIRDKYVEPPYTTSFGILFLPFEGLYAEVVNHGLVETLQHDYNISIAGPSTMAALLNALQMGFRTLTIQKRSHEVWQVLGAVKTEFQKFEEILAATQKHMLAVSGDLDKLVGVRTRAINRQLRSIEQLDPQTAQDVLQLD